MPSDVILKRGDTKPPLIMQLIQTTDGTTIPINLTTATSVTFQMRADFDTVLGGACSILNAAQGLVTYAWTTDDTGFPTLYIGEFKIQWADGGVQTVPSGNTTQGTDVGDFLTIEIVEDIAGVAPVITR